MTAWEEYSKEHVREVVKIEPFGTQHERMLGWIEDLDHAGAAHKHNYRLISDNIRAVMND